LAVQAAQLAVVVAILKLGSKLAALGLAGLPLNKAVPRGLPGGGAAKGCRAVGWLLLRPLLLLLLVLVCRMLLRPLLFCILLLPLLVLILLALLPRLLL
jgi:hypothetical protein